MSPVSVNSNLEKFIEDNLLTDIFVKNNELFFVLRGMGIYPNPDKTVKLRTDFKERVFTHIKALPNLEEIAKRVDAFMTSCVRSPQVENKTSIIDAIITRETLASLDVEFIKSIYDPTQIPEAILTTLKDGIESKKPYKNPEEDICEDLHEGIHDAEPEEPHHT
jgi:hypothetical protein